MTNRFQKKQLGFRRSPWIRISIFGFLVFFALTWYGISAIGNSNLEKQQESLENALMRDIVQCYAVEGTYPPSLEYMETHYALTYDHNLFFVDYQALGSNLFPDVTVIRRKHPS